MPRGHDGAVVLVVKRGAAEVHHSDGRVLHGPLFPFLQNRQKFVTSKRLNVNAAPCRKNESLTSHLLHVVGHGEVRVHKQDVLRLQVRVRQLTVMEN